MTIVHQIVDRCHVGMSDLALLRYVRSRMRARARRGPKYREFRRQAYREALDRHHENQADYARIMRGNL